MRNQAAEAIGASLAKVSPPAAVTVASVSGMGLQDWVYAATLVYTVLLITHHVWTKIYTPWRDRRKV